MKTLAIELRKGKRTGVIPVLLAVGVLGAAYAFVNFNCAERHTPEFAAGPDGCLVDPALRHDYGAESVRYRGCCLHDLQHGI